MGKQLRLRASSIIPDRRYDFKSQTKNFSLMTRGKIVAVLTGAIAVAIAVAYLLLVALLDARGPMVPAPPSFVLSWF